MPFTRNQAPEREASDEALMERYAAGDRSAFDQLFERYEPRAFSYFVRRTRCAERARDLYQELFLRIHRSRHAYDSRRAFAPWFFQIARRLLIDDNRLTYRAQELSLEKGGEARAVRPGRSDPVAEREHLAKLLARLSEGERYVLIASKCEGAGYAEIAHRLGKSADAVKKAASRAMQRLRETSPPAPARAAAQPRCARRLAAR